MLPAERVDGTVDGVDVACRELSGGRVEKVRGIECGSSAVVREASVTGRLSRRAKTYALGTIDDDSRKDQLGIGRIVLRPVTVERSHDRAVGMESAIRYGL